METSKKKIDILEHIIAAVAGAYYNINLTRNLVPGQMYQAVDGKEYNVNEMTGLPAGSRTVRSVHWHWGVWLQIVFRHLSMQKIWNLRHWENFCSIR